MPSERVLLVEDDWIAARAVQKALETAGLVVTEVASSAEEALASLMRTPADVVLLDTELREGLDGIQLARELRARSEVAVVFVTSRADVHTVSRAADIGAAGFVVKPFQEAQLLSAVVLAVRRPRAHADRSVAAGAPSVSRELSLEPLDDRGRELQRVAAAVSDPLAAGIETNLTRRELEIVRLMLSNGRVRSIAEQLSISPHTVRNHLRSIFRKLGVHSQVELIRELTTQRPPRRIVPKAS